MRIDRIKKSFGKKVIFDGFSADFPKGSKNLITGKSGIGKTTLLRIIAGLEDYESGNVILDNSEIVAFMFQEPRLFPWMNVISNVNSVLHKPDFEKSSKILAELGLINESEAMPSELSGGMKRRVSLARTLLYSADIYLFDEPFAGLDPDIAKTSADVLLDYTRDKTVIIVSHDRSMLDNNISTIEI